MSVICFSSNETKSRSLLIPFAAAENKYNFLGTTFFGRFVKKINISDFIMNYKHYFIDQLTSASFTTLIEKIFRFFYFIYQIDPKTPTSIKTITLLILQFSLKIIQTLLLTTGDIETVAAKMPQTLSIYGKFIKKRWKFLLSSTWKYYYALCKTSRRKKRIFKNSCYHCKTNSLSN